MSRSIWKGPYIDQSIWKKLKKVTEISEKNKAIKIWNRRSMITPELIGVRAELYTGNKWVNLNLNEDRIGHFFGEFASTKKIAQYKRKAKAKKKGK